MIWLGIHHTLEGVLAMMRKKPVWWRFPHVEIATGVTWELFCCDSRCSMLNWDTEFIFISSSFLTLLSTGDFFFCKICSVDDPTSKRAKRTAKLIFWFFSRCLGNFVSCCSISVGLLFHFVKFHCYAWCRKTYGIFLTESYAVVFCTVSNRRNGGDTPLRVVRVTGNQNPIPCDKQVNNQIQVF